MVLKLIKYIFFGNFFIGVLAIALSIETCYQLRLHINSTFYYLFLFFGTVMYYSYAYSAPVNNINSTNERTKWYSKHQLFAKWNLLISGMASVSLALFLILKNYNSIINLPVNYWLIILLEAIAGLLYYGLTPKSLFRLKLRNIGWLKPFVIGFEWATCVSLLPLVMLKIEQDSNITSTVLIGWLFIKNWMFCTVNAIMFDMKDYAEDANRRLNTFVVRLGLRKTIFFVIIPLLLIGVSALATFFYARDMGLIAFSINLLPFILLITIAYSMHRRKNILFYLVVIDGVLLIKAICGIVGMQFVH